jgi:hypothetical protein
LDYRSSLNRWNTKPQGKQSGIIPSLRSWLLEHFGKDPCLRDTGRFDINELDEAHFAAEQKEWDSRLNVDNARFSQYADWLRNTRRQHSLSNVIWFVNKNPGSHR